LQNESLFATQPRHDLTVSESGHILAGQTIIWWMEKHPAGF